MAQKHIRPAGLEMRGATASRMLALPGEQRDHARLHSAGRGEGHQRVYDRPHVGLCCRVSAIRIKRLVHPGPSCTRCTTRLYALRMPWRTRLLPGKHILGDV